MIDPAFRDLSGGALGAIVATAASALPPAPSFGPPLVVVLGYDLALLPALLGVAGVVATRAFAPVAAVEARLQPGARHALTGMMVLAMLALILAGEKRPLVIVGIAGGLGYSGVAIFELLAVCVVKATRLAIAVVTRGTLSILKDSPEEGE